MPVVGGNEYDIRLRYFDDQMFGDIMLRPEWLDSDDLVIGSPIESGFSLTNSEWEVFEFVNEPAPAGAVNLRYSIVTANIFEPGVIYIDNAEVCGDSTTHTPTMTPTLRPTETPTPPCVDIGIYNYEIMFNPEKAVPGDLVEITVPVHNEGALTIDSVLVTVAYEDTPLDPEDDPNPAVIDTVEILGLAPGDSETVTVAWDTSGLESITYPVYVFTEASIPE